MDTQRPDHILPHHWEEWRKSLVDPEIIALNVKSFPGQILLEILTENKIEATQSVQYPTEPTKRLLERYDVITEGDGWFVSGVDPSNDWDRMEWGQIKPDSPRPDPGKDGKFIKYETLCGLDARLILLDVPSRIAEKIYQRYEVNPSQDDKAIGFWHCVHVYNIPIVITEGGKKAGFLLTIGFAAIALPGVTMGMRKDPKPHLIPDLEYFATWQRKFIFCFDADQKQKTQNLVKGAINKTASLLNTFGCHIFTAGWKSGRGKGIDDVGAVEGIEAVKEILSHPKEWKEPAKKDDERPRAAQLASELAEIYRPKLVYDDESCAWMHYEADENSKGIWSVQTDLTVGSVIQAEVEARLGTDYSANYINDILKLIRYKLLVRGWDEAMGVIPFTNGVLDPNTGKFMPHAPGYRLTWTLPREHNPLADDWGTINQWLDEATGHNAKLKKVLLCWLNACLKGRYDLQRFLHLTGPGGSGKGTFTRLAMSLIGGRNTHCTTLLDWCQNRFESFNAYRKRLIILPDEDKYSGGLARFKSLTGGDFIRAEAKGKPGFQFRFEGMVMVSSNYPIFMGDSSGIDRRAIIIPFSNPVSREKQRNLDREFEPELAALTNYVLSIPDEEVSYYLLQTSTESPEIFAQTLDHRMRADSIAAWLNDCCVLDEEELTQIGSDKGNAQTLFGSYWQYCDRIGAKPKNLREFSPNLLELANLTLEMPVEKIINKNGKHIKGLRLRGEFDSSLPNPIESLVILPQKEKVTDRGVVTDGVTDGVTGKTPMNGEGDGCDGSDLSEEIKGAKKDVDSGSKSGSRSEDLEGFFEKTETHSLRRETSHPSHPSPSHVEPVLPVTPSVTHPSPEGFHPSPKGVGIGDRVKYTGNHPNYSRQYGNSVIEITKVQGDKAMGRLSDGSFSTYLPKNELKKIGD